MSPTRVLTSAAALLVALGVGFATARLTGDPHTATAERVTGTVTWSNQQTRLFAFAADGGGSGEAEETYRLTTDHWTDAAGTIRADGSYPQCLAARPGDPVSTDRRRVALEVVHQSLGGAQRVHVAVAVHCLAA